MNDTFFYRIYKELVVERLRVTGYPALGTKSESGMSLIQTIQTILDETEK